MAKITWAVGITMSYKGEVTRFHRSAFADKRRAQETRDELTQVWRAANVPDVGVRYWLWRKRQSKRLPRRSVFLRGVFLRGVL